jgi:alpha-galactosidase/6-phospho-beta-glucosidase family protein
VRALLLQVKEYERLTVRACLSRSTELALSALVKNPLIGDREAAHGVLMDYMNAFGDQMPLYAAKTS